MRAMRIEAKPLPSWLPFTPGGIVALARFRRGRLFRVQCVGAALLVGSFLWFLNAAWYPVIETAASQLPAQAGIRAGVLEWTGPTPIRLAENQFLSVTVDPDRTASPRSTTDIEIELGAHELRARSLLGYVAWPYSTRYRVDLSRTEFQAWWGAWRQPLLAMVGVAALLVVFFTWTLLALLYAPVAHIIGFYADRTAPFHVSWRLAMAALLPGSVVLAGVIILYGLQQIDLIGLLFGVTLHLVIGWLYLLVSPLALPYHSNSTKRRKGNPFRQ
jgi:hypothetical protein